MATSTTLSFCLIAWLAYSVGNMIEKMVVTCGSPVDASGWVEALGKDQAQVTVMNGPSTKSQNTQVCKAEGC